MRTLMIVALLGAAFLFNAAYAAEAACPDSGGLKFVCGIKNGEDLVLVPNTPWIIASGFAEDTGLTLIDSRNGTHSKVYPDTSASVKHDAQFADCATPPEHVEVGDARLASASRQERSLDAVRGRPRLT